MSVSFLFHHAENPPSSGNATPVVNAAFGEQKTAKIKRCNIPFPA
jgi:hypothetical protein